MRKLKAVVLVLSALFMAAIVSGCSEDSNEDAAHKQINSSAEKRVPYIPKNDVEFRNYTKAAKLQDSPDTIIWCSVMPQASTAPILTVPIAGKLTSSSTTFFNPMERVAGSNGAVALPTRSVDGLYHPNPPQYRFGFTPGDVYVDFFNLPTFCTTQPLDFQKDSVAVKVDNSLNDATKRAEKALAAGKHAEAQKILEEAAE